MKTLDQVVEDACGQDALADIRGATLQMLSDIVENDAYYEVAKIVEFDPDHTCYMATQSASDYIAEQLERQ